MSKSRQRVSEMQRLYASGGKQWQYLKRKRRQDRAQQRLVAAVAAVVDDVELSLALGRGEHGGAPIQDWTADASPAQPAPMPRRQNPADAARVVAKLVCMDESNFDNPWFAAPKFMSP